MASKIIFDTPMQAATGKRGDGWGSNSKMSFKVSNLREKRAREG